ncbi:MAG: signal peptidase II [Acidobacteriota bacterium]|nr:signal peptidase II [Acidobacteriota bacterium]
MPKSLSRYAASAISLGILALDRWSKHIIETRFSAFDSHPVIPGFFDIVKSQNPGVAFGLFSESTSRFRTGLLIAFSLLAVAILAGILWRIEKLDRLTAVGVSLIFGGALGNVYDRVMMGTVTDFLDFYIGARHWYTFNLADSAICVGASLLLLGMRKPGSNLAGA